LVVLFFTIISLVFLITVFLFALTANADNYNTTFNAVTVTEIGVADDIRSGDTIKCKILNIESNVTIKLAQNSLEESFDTSVGYSKNITIPNDCVKFSVYQFENSSNIWSKFRILNALTNSTYYFIMADEGLQLYKINNVTESIEWDQFYEIDNFLTKGIETEFWFDYRDNDLVFGSEKYGIVVILPISKETRPHIMQIEGQYVANALWDLKDCSNSSKEYTFDKLSTYCWNSTDDDDNNENNGTETFFTNMIEVQYRLNKVMAKDLSDFKKNGTYQ